MILTGVGVSAGSVVGPVARLVTRRHEPLSTPAPADLTAEAGRIGPALDEVAANLQQRADAATGSIAEILGATAMMAQDPGLRTGAEQFVAEHRVPAERAVWVVAGQYASTLAAAGGYLAERVTDLQDVRDRVVARLTGLPTPGLPEPGHPYVLVATDLAPADTATLDVDKVLALVTEEGGPTGHTAIIARSLGLPGVVACPAAALLTEGQVVAVDGSSGEVDTEADLALVTRSARPRTLTRLEPGPVTTSDGQPVVVLANVGDERAAARAVELGAIGSGLFRTELLFLDRTRAPSVSEQTSAYTAVLSAFETGRVVVRTLDAGADKPLPFLAMGDEPNPALGVRGLRVALDQEQVLTDQLTAITAAREASAAEVWVMAPMVATVAEARWFRERCAAAGLRENIGIMVEVPAAALLADELFEVVDFVSIGTNDLTQYTLAADRVSGRLAELNDPWQPAVLRLVQMVTAAGRRHDKPVGVCGEAAADPLLACVLVGLGVTSLSADAGALAAVAGAVHGASTEQCAKAASAACAATSPDAARDAARRQLEAAATTVAPR